MAAFDYEAVDARGKTKKGVIEGDTPRQARALLREQGLMPTNVVPILASKKSKSGKTSNRSNKGKVSAAELALITRQLATLVESGLPLEEALVAIAEQGEKNAIKSMIMGVRTKVTEGYGLAESMAEYPKVFNHLYRAMVAAGETELIEVCVIADSPKPVTPCGGCRQKLAEFGRGDVLVRMATVDGPETIMSISELLPGAFDPDHMERTK